jgi:DNA-directed RNA polymerase subunit RPC12/RpoP
MNERQQQIRQLVIDLDSYTGAAKQLGITKQRVGQLAGKGLTTSTTTAICIDCGAELRTTKGVKAPRCSRCQKYIRLWGERRTPFNMRQRKLRAAAIRGANARRSHCVRGHTRIPENLYANGNCRLCALGPEARAQRKDYHRRRYASYPEYRATKKRK